MFFPFLNIKLGNITVKAISFLYSQHVFIVFDTLFSPFYLKAKLFKVKEARNELNTSSGGTDNTIHNYNTIASKRTQ